MSETPKQPSLLDWIKNIESERNVLLNDDNEKSFSPFIIGRVLTRNQDTLPYAYQLNFLHFLDKKLQYKYLHKAVTKKKRYGKWGAMKAEKPSDVELYIMNNYNVNIDIARQYLEIHTDKQIKDIKLQLKREKNNGKRGK